MNKSDKSEFPSQPVGDGELRECPFCGGTAAWSEGEQKAKYGNEQAYCTNCYATTAPEMTKAEAAEWWNARTAPVEAQPTQPLADLVPTNWLDPLFSGPNAVLQGRGGTWGCPDIERLLRAVKKRIADAEGRKAG